MRTQIYDVNLLQMFTNAGNSEFSRDFYLQTDYDKTALDDIYGRYIEKKIHKRHIFLLQLKQMRPPLISSHDLGFAAGEREPRAREPSRSPGFS